MNDDNILDDYIHLKNEGTYLKIKYISAKTKELQEFGYTDLTEKTVAEQLEKMLKKEKLNVIGMLIEKDLKDILK
jgi:hypothetical protein